MLVGGLVGCGKKVEAPPPAPPKMDTPRDTADSWLRASNGRDAALAAQLLPPDEVLKKGFDCPADQLSKAVKARRDGLAKQLAALPKDATTDIGSFDKSGSDDRELRAGDEFEGCKAKGLVLVHTSKIDLRRTAGGATAFDAEAWTFVKVGDDPKWYFLR